MGKLEAFKQERILEEGLQEDGQIQVEEAKARDKVGQTHWGGKTKQGRRYSHTERIYTNTVWL